jgi:hypothetical protein
MVFAATAFAQQGAEFRPFTAEMRVVHTPGPGGVPLIQEVFYARRGDGSYVMHQQVTNPDGELEMMVSIFDMRMNRSITLHPSLRASVTFYYSEGAMSAQPWRGVDSCKSLTMLGVLGDTTERVMAHLNGREARRIVEEDPKDGQRTERWVAEDLDCFPLQKTITGGRGVPQQTTVARLTEGEPADSLFVVPPEYMEMSPVETEAAYQTRYPGSLLYGQMLELMQKRYEDSLLRRP